MTPSNPPGTTEAVRDFAPLREATLQSAKDSKDPEVLLKAATVLKYGADLDKQGVEIAVLKQNARTETVRFLVPIIAPLISALAVLGALIFQTIQFRFTTEIQRQTVATQMKTAEIQARATEDAEWREAVKTFTSGPSAGEGYAGTALLLVFLKQGHHVQEARALTLSVLGQSFSMDMFEPLFNAAMQATPDSERVNAALKLTKRLKSIYFRAIAEQKRISGPAEEDLPSLTVEGGRQIPNPFWAARQVMQEVTYVCNFLSPQLRVPRTQQSALNLADSAFWDCDLSGADFSNAVLDRINFSNVNLDNADLGGVTSFENSDWNGTAWWRARRISPQLLQELKRRFPFRPAISYPGGATKTEYESRLAALSRQS